MATFVRDPEPIELQELREYRERHDLDHRDEVWDGVLHTNPIPTGEHQYILQQLAVLIIDHKERRVHWFALRDGEYEPVERSALIELGPAELAEQLTWP
jgi:hypothetical protein